MLQMKNEEWNDKIHNINKKISRKISAYHATIENWKKWKWIIKLN